MPGRARRMGPGLTRWGSSLGREILVAVILNEDPSTKTALMIDTQWCLVMPIMMVKEELMAKMAEFNVGWLVDIHADP